MSKKLPYIRKVLANGLTVLVYPMDWSTSVGMVLRVKAAGRDYEEERGLAHVSEHYLLSGTKSYPTPQSFNEMGVRIGMNWNAVTSDEYIDVEAHMPNYSLEKGLQLFQEVVFEPVFPESQLGIIRNTVMQEWHDRHDSPGFRFGKKLREARVRDPNYFYIRDESLPLLQRFTREDVTGFHRRFFQPQQMILGVGGGVDVEEVLKMVGGLFGKFAAGKAIKEPKPKKDPYAGRAVVTHEEKKSQANFEINFPAFGWRERDRDGRAAAGFLERILGAAYVSRLWRKLREETGWVYSVGSGIDWWPFMGISYIGGSCGTDKLPEVFKVVRDELGNILSEGPTGDEMELARDYRLARLAIGFEQSFDVASYLVGEEFSGEGIELKEQKMARVKRIKKEAVWTVAKEVFDFKRVQVGLMNDFAQISEGKFEGLVGELFPA